MKSLLFSLGVVLTLNMCPVCADDSVVPTGGFPASRYEVLWTKSPFAVETDESVTESSPDYTLVGFASNIEGISYASLIETQSNDHILISTDKPVRGLTLTSITIGKNGSDTYAVVQKNGQPITLKLQQAPAAVAGAVPNMAPSNVPGPGGLAPQIQVPGASSPNMGSVRPMPTRFHRTPIHLPPRSDQGQQPAPAP